MNNYTITKSESRYNDSIKSMTVVIYVPIGESELKLEFKDYPIEGFCHIWGNKDCDQKIIDRVCDLLLKDQKVLLNKFVKRALDDGYIKDQLDAKQNPLYMITDLIY
jgi:hypothetical protein